LKRLTLIFLFFLIQVSFPQESDKMITVIGKELKGHFENNESIREVIGDVVLTQGNVVITCDTAIQFISRNSAHLIGNVIVTQDTLTIYTDEGFYFGNERRAYSDKGVKLDDKKVILTARKGEYFFNENLADFHYDVKLYDTVSTLTSDRLLYYREIDKAIATGTVKIVDVENTINSDSLEHYRDSQITFGFGNVIIRSFTNNTSIYGDHIEDYRVKNYSLVDENPLLIQIDSSYRQNKKEEIDSLSFTDTTISSTAFIPDSLFEDSTLVIDTLIIKAGILEAYRDTSNFFIAKDSVKMVRGEFASRNDYTIFYRDEEKIITFKVDDEAKPPVLWYENSQLTGDSLTIYLQDRKIERVDVNRNAAIGSQNELYKDRWDQVSGMDVNLYFGEDGLEKTEVFENVLSIYFMYEEDDPNGLIKASSKDAVIEFEEKKVANVRLYGNPNSEYHPENLVSGKEREFVLPKFVIYLDRPVKEEILNHYFSKDETEPEQSSIEESEIIE